MNFDHVIVDSTPNNGEYTFTVPEGWGVTEEARIMIKAIDNYFLNVNTTNFTVDSTLGINDANLSTFNVYRIHQWYFYNRYGS